jgi:hypothetical protein
MAKNLNVFLKCQQNHASHEGHTGKLSLQLMGDFKMLKLFLKISLAKLVSENKA